YIVPGCEEASWQSWQRFGTFAFRSFTERLPCGLWQLRQLSSTGGCSNMNGPRLSAWHVVQSSLMLSALTIAGDSAPCGLWQLVHFTLPSTIGWCDGRDTRPRMSRWQLKQTSCCGTREVVLKGAISGLVILSCESCPPCRLWQLVQVTSFLRCLPESQNARWRLDSWQARQTRSFSAAGIDLDPGFTMPPTPRPPPASTCFVPSPWQVAQPAPDAGDIGCPVLPCTDFAIESK